MYDQYALSNWCVLDSTSTKVNEAGQLVSVGLVSEKMVLWRSNLPRVSRCVGGKSSFKEPEAGWTVSRRKEVDVRTDLVSLGCQQEGE